MIARLQKALSEFTGTFALVFFGTGAVVVNTAYTSAGLEPIGHLGISLTFGSIVALMVYMFGPISGAHINPAVTISFWLRKQISALDSGFYILAQLLGAFAASLSIHILFPDDQNLGKTAISVVEWKAFALEVFLTFMLMITIFRIIASESNRLLTGVVIGGIIFIEALVAGPITGASMNPARSFGPAAVLGDYTHFWIYVAAPILGAVIATFFDRLYVLATENQSES